ncbi:MAG: hypothetical protein ACYTBJ_15720 [Planctomycetota bacterium]|jgi:hypothetical protein
MSGQETVRIFIMPQEFPCGEQSSCCGPIGQSAEEIDGLKSSIEKQLGYEVEVLNVRSDDDMRDYPQIARLFQSLGAAALPILAFEDEVVSMGDSTPEKVVPAIRENTEKNNFGKEEKMSVNDNSERAGGQESTSDMQPCCSSASDNSCCPSAADGAGGKSWKTLVFILIVIAAGVVLARSLINKSNSTSDQTQQPFAVLQPECSSESPSPAKAAVTPETPADSEAAMNAPAVVNTPEKAKLPDEPASTLLFKPLDSLASLNKVAANFDAVFILLAAEDQLKMQPIAKQVETAAKKIQGDGVRVSAFTLEKDAPNYSKLVKQFSIPCVLAIVKSRGMSGVSGEITEAKLIQAFVTASRPRSSCCPGGATCAPKPGPTPTK